MDLVLIKAVETALAEKTHLDGWEQLSSVELDLALTFCALGAWLDRPSQEVRSLAQAMLGNAY